MALYNAAHIWQNDAWQRSATDRASFAVDVHGRYVDPGRDSGEYLGQWLLPGVCNSHSHAFQRAMSGLAERQHDPSDSFWTWRELMYRYAQKITPQIMYAIASQLYAEMLEAGYTSVCEFHYIHHQADGRPYVEPAEMSNALIAAARDVGIRMTLLPVLYRQGGFDGRALSDRQRRFGNTIDEYLSLLQSLRQQRSDMLNIGVAFHSLRAVSAEDMRTVCAELAGQELPIHIHIAEQQAELVDCQDVLGARPVQWLLSEFPVDHRWTLVHATHVDSKELQGIVNAGASVALCPTTEANLGDGIFPLADFLAAGGSFSVGSDSNVSVSLIEELRWLEYGQRLQHQRRNIAASADMPSTAERLYRTALHGGVQAAMNESGSIANGQLADFIVLNDHAPALLAARAENVLDRMIFAGNQSLVRNTYVGGHCRVENGRHVNREHIWKNFQSAYLDLMG